MGALLLGAGMSSGCGSSIGDACTTDQDCGGRTCDSDHRFPGGYCTEHCVVGDASTCPSGSTCAAHHDETLCLRSCAERAGNTECRNGYLCKAFKSEGTFCLSPDDN